MSACQFFTPQNVNFSGQILNLTLFKPRFDYDLFWFCETFICITAKLLKIIEPNLVFWLLTLQGLGLMKKCTKNRLKSFLMIKVNGHITISFRPRYTLNMRKLKQNTGLKQDLGLGFTRSCYKVVKQMGDHRKYSKIWRKFLVNEYRRLMVGCVCFLKFSNL